MKNEIITIKIKSSSEECEKIREAGQFFEIIADVLSIKRWDIKEIKNFRLII